MVDFLKAPIPPKLIAINCDIGTVSIQVSVPFLSTSHFVHTLHYSTMKVAALLVLAALARAALHPGLLHTEADFNRIRGFINAEQEPWLTGWSKLVARVNPEYQPSAAAVVCRGASWCSPENYPVLYRDAHAAYVNAIYWKVTGAST